MIAMRGLSGNEVLTTRLSSQNLPQKTTPQSLRKHERASCFFTLAVHLIVKQRVRLPRSPETIQSREETSPAQRALRALVERAGHTECAFLDGQFA